MYQTFKQFILEDLVNHQHEDFKNKVMQLLNVTALSPQDRDIVHNGMKTGLSPEDVARQLLQPRTDTSTDLPPELDLDPDGMQTAGGPGLSGG